MGSRFVSLGNDGYQHRGMFSYSGLSLEGQISPATKLVLVTGFCGGFTTFSTFMNENLLLGRDGAMLSAVLYTLASLALGLIAVIIGYQIVK